MRSDPGVSVVPRRNWSGRGGEGTATLAESKEVLLWPTPCEGEYRFREIAVESSI